MLSTRKINVDIRCLFRCVVLKFSAEHERCLPLNSLENISPLLIANRGEIACRIVKTAKKLGLETIAVYSDADRSSLHVRSAQRAFFLGGPQPQESYLNVKKILDAAKLSGARSVHPGYGFLSENGDFAEACVQENLIFVGPPPSAIRSMGLKNTAKNLMSSAGVPVIVGYHGDDQSESTLKMQAEKIGFPVMLKAVRGGGGKGMRISLSAKDFGDQLESAKREALKAFGNDDMIVEKFVENPRHVEVQIFGDQHGNYVYLFERDCSVQRRHQKIIEEAPAPNIPDATRRKLGEAACKAAAAVGYVGAGTVEFIMDHKQNFYFMEMNTRLQVEHPVTEMITGFDLVEWQLRVASGESLPMTDQNEIKFKGHSFEVRVYAEDPDNNFMPGTGTVSYLSIDDRLKSKANVRIETGIVEGDQVSVYYDPMIAKLVVWSPDGRTRALSSLVDVLRGYKIVGLRTNVPFLSRLAKHPKFQAGDVHTNFIPNHANDLLPTTTEEWLAPDVVICKATLAAIAFESQHSIKAEKVDMDPFDLLDCFHNNLTPSRTISLTEKDELHKIFVEYGKKDCFRLTLRQNEIFDCKIMHHTFDINADRSVVKLLVEINGAISSVTVVKLADTLTVLDTDSTDFWELDVAAPSFVKLLQDLSDGDDASDDCLMPIPGIVEKIFVQPGAAVDAGDPLVVVVAMKMEYVIRAPGKRVVDKILCAVGENVPKNAHLVTFRHDTTEARDPSVK